MARVMMLGIDPAQVDFSDPALPPGLDASKISAGIAAGLERLRADGHEPSGMFVSSDPAQLAALAERLSRDPVDCVTIGGGVTRPLRHTELFEAVLNIIGGVTPTPRIALIMGPENAPEAVARVLG